jgi:hypothetical protein
VLPHDGFEKHEANLWTVTGKCPGLPLDRRMMIVRLSDGRLLFFNAVPMNEEALAELRTWGTPSFLIVPAEQHCIDAPAFREHLGLRAFAPKPCAAKIEKRMPIDGHIEDIPADARVRIETVEGVRHGEPAMFVTGDGGAVSAIFCDVFQNHTREHTKLLFRLMGFSGARTPPIFKLAFLRNKPALRAQMERWAALPTLKRLIPTHGPIVDDDAAEVLKHAAQVL